MTKKQWKKVRREEWIRKVSTVGKKKKSKDSLTVARASYPLGSLLPEVVDELPNEPTQIIHLLPLIINLLPQHTITNVGSFEHDTASTFIPSPYKVCYQHTTVQLPESLHCYSRLHLLHVALVKLYSSTALLMPHAGIAQCKAAKKLFLYMFFLLLLLYHI